MSLPEFNDNTELDATGYTVVPLSDVDREAWEWFVYATVFDSPDMWERARAPGENNESMAIVTDNGSVAAAMVLFVERQSDHLSLDHDRLYVALLETAASHRRRGLASYLLSLAAAKTLAFGYDDLEMVTIESESGQSFFDFVKDRLGISTDWDGFLRIDGAALAELARMSDETLI